jgi:hypothetical protein
MVMQGTTLIVRIIRIMFVLSADATGVVMVDVINLATLAEVGSDILFVLEGMLDMDAD